MVYIYWNYLARECYFIPVAQTVPQKVTHGLAQKASASDAVSSETKSEITN
jgi:hypothetical protein